MNPVQKLKESFPSYEKPVQCYGRYPQKKILLQEIGRPNPKGIRHLVGPRGSGKTNLVQCVLLERMYVAYIHWRFEQINNIDQLNNKLRKMFKLDSLFDYLTNIPSDIRKQFYSWIPDILTNRIEQEKASLEETLLQIQAILQSTQHLVSEDGINKPVLFIDEFDAMKGIKEKEPLKMFFNWLISISKDLGLAHVIVASSDSFLYQNEEYQQLIKFDYINFMELEDLSKEEQALFIQNKKVLSEQQLSQIGGHAKDLIDALDDPNTINKKKIKFQQQWEKMISQANQTCLENASYVLFWQKQQQQQCYTVQDALKIISIIFDKKNPSLNDFKNASISMAAVEKLIIENYIFYKPESYEIKFNSNIQAIVWRELFEQAKEVGDRKALP